MAEQAAPLVLYAAQATSCWETWQVSLHQTKAGAWRAGHAWLLAQWDEWHAIRRVCGKRPDQFRATHLSFKVIPVEVCE